MVKRNLVQSTRSIYLGLACLSLTLHLLLACFCLSVLQTACTPPASSTSSSIPRTDPQSRQSFSSPAASSSDKLPSGLQKANAFDPDREKALRTETDEEKTQPRPENLKQRVKGHSKLEELFSHPLYNLPRPPMQQDDWLLRVKADEDGGDEGSEEEEKEDFLPHDSECHTCRQSTSQEEGYDETTWTSDKETHPPWLRFHLGISRWELYDRKDSNLAQLTHYLATQPILRAGEPKDRENMEAGGIHRLK